MTFSERLYEDDSFLERDVIDEDEHDRIFEERHKKLVESGQLPKLIYPTPIFFQDPVGKDRGRELFEVNTKERTCFFLFIFEKIFSGKI